MYEAPWMVMHMCRWPAVVILPLKPNNTVPVVSKLSQAELLEVTTDLARVCNTKHTHQVRQLDLQMQVYFVE